MGKLAVCNLTRQDILATDPLYELAHEEYRRRQHPHESLLSPVDIMIVAMAFTFRRKHSGVFLVTADRQMARVATRVGLTVLNPASEQTIPARLQPPR